MRDSYVDSKTIKKIKILSQKFSHYFWEREEFVIREKHTRASGVLATFISWLGWQLLLNYSLYYTYVIIVPLPLPPKNNKNERRGEGRRKMKREGGRQGEEEKKRRKGEKMEWEGRREKKE